MPKRPHSKTTRPGLGQAPAPEVPAPEELPEAARPDEAPARSPSRRPSAPPASWAPEATTGTRTRVHTERGSRPPPVVVDEVGAAAVKLAHTTRRESAPTLLASRAVISRAPIDTRAAFVLSLVDGRNTVPAIVDMSGMVEDEVKAILERVARLGLIALP